MKKAPPPMNGTQREALLQAHRRLSRTLTPAMAVPVLSAVSAGWSRRTISAALGIARERTERLCALEVPALMDLPRYSRTAPFPEAAVTAYRTAQAKADSRRARAAAVLSGLIRAAHDSGYSYTDIGAVLNTSGEWARRLASAEPAHVPPVFTPAPAPAQPSPRGHLSEEERGQMRALADLARQAARIPAGTTDPERLDGTLKARRASEQLSAMIAAAKARRVTWPEIDEACGYAPGSARARAKRHGYSTRPKSVPAYTATDPGLLERAGLPAT